jgi:Protein of unknown function, DUF488
MKALCSFDQMGTLYTLGYAADDATTQLQAWMRKDTTYLIDIRKSPHSYWLPQWEQAALAATYGPRYRWEPRFGNLNYRNPEAGIALAVGHEEAARSAALWLAHGYSLVLLCACKNPRSCHRSLVAKLVQDALDALRNDRDTVPFEG